MEPVVLDVARVVAVMVLEDVLVVAAMLESLVATMVAEVAVVVEVVAVVDELKSVVVGDGEGAVLHIS